MNETKMIHLGSSSKAHGIKGAFLFNLFNIKDSTLSDGMSILIKGKEGSSIVGEEKRVTIEKINIGNKAVCFLEGINNRNITEDMVPFDILIDRSDLPEEEGEEVYLNDLIGMDCINEKNEKIGIINRLYDNKAQDIVEIKLLDNELIDIPLVDAFVLDVNLEKREMKVLLPEYI